MSPRRSPGDGTVYKRADGMWIGGVELPRGPNNERRQKRVSAKSRNEALRKWKELKATIDAGLDPVTGRTTVAKWMEHWLDAIHRKKRIGPASYRSYDSLIRNHIVPNIGTMRMDRITPQDVRDLYAKQESSAAQKTHGVLGLAFKAAVREGIVHRNIMEAVDRPQHMKRERTSFTYDQSVHILKTALSADNNMATARWAGGFMTGGRQGELLGLTWDRVDLTEGEESVDLSWQLLRQNKTHGCGDPVDGTYPCGFIKTSFCPEAHWVFEPAFEWLPCERTFVWTRPKSAASRRQIPLIPPMVAALKRVRAIDTPNPHNLVFRHPDGKPIGRDQDHRAWSALLKSAEIPHAEQHTMRHSTATLLMRSGVSEHVVQSILGHTDATTTRGYQHVDLSLARAALSNLNGLLPTG